LSKKWFVTDLIAVMSNLSICPQALERRRTQPHVRSYFDTEVFEQEQLRIFARAPRYVGHSLCVPELGDYHALPQEGEGRLLVRSAQGVSVLSNVCRHRQALMLRGSGNTQSHMVCPLHRWTYNLQGELVGAPHFDQDPCRHLARTPVEDWNGLLFEAPRLGNRQVGQDLAGLGPQGDLDFTGYVLDKVQIHECNYNWKTFIEVYLEDYHVAPFHPGLSQFVSCEDLSWEFGAHHSVQTVGVNNGLAQPGSAVYRRWQDAVLAYQNGKPPECGAIWLTYYPTVMVEWYPQVLVVSTLFAVSPQKTLNRVEFFYPEEIAAFERDYVQAQQAAYWETCAEDDEIALRIDAGRQALMQRGENDAGPYQSPMEDGMKEFHAWYGQAMGTA
jgi:choline monooxygenase